MNKSDLFARTTKRISLLFTSSGSFPKSGACGIDLTWVLNDGILTISGTGDMASYDDVSTSPWANNRTIIEVVITDGVTSIGNDAFMHCCMKSITIPDSVTSIGYRAFIGCTSLKSITIPNSVESVKFGTFVGCRNLTEINVDDGHSHYVSIDDVLFDAEKRTLISYPNGKRSKSYIIPDSVTSIGDAAFCGCERLTSITIPNSVTSIGEHVFWGCSRLTPITIPDSVKSIGKSTLHFLQQYGLYRQPWEL